MFNTYAHYNPHNKKHGGPDSKERHVGDLGNIKANKNGIVKMKISDKLVKLRGKYNVIGRSIVIHEDEDDLGLGAHNDSLTTGHEVKELLVVLLDMLVLKNVKLLFYIF